MFKLENRAGERIVVKFQKESPVEALAGTRIVQAAGVQTTAVRRCSDEELVRLTSALRSAPGIDAKALSAWTDASQHQELVHRLLMDFADGVTLKSAREQHVAVFLDAPWTPPGAPSPPATTCEG